MIFSRIHNSRSNFPIPLRLAKPANRGIVRLHDDALHASLIVAFPFPNSFGAESPL